MEDADSDGVSSTQESCVPEGEDVERVLNGDEDDAMSDIASEGDESVPSYGGVMAGEKDGEYLSSSDEDMSTDKEDETTLSDSASDTRGGEFDDEPLAELEDDNDMVPMAYHKL